MRKAHRKACATGALIFALCTSGAAADELQSGQDFSQIERGRYLTLAGDCAACHTDPQHKGAFAGGRRIETPFGNVAAANITPDRESGIGAWSDVEFDAALRLGVMPNGKRLYPAMPYPYFTRMTHDDVIAIRAYLNTVAPVHRNVRSNQLPFPFNIRAAMRIWDALYFDAGTLIADGTKSASWNRGAYLIEGPGHCGACHTPKTFLGGDKDDQKFRGYSIQGWFAPDITNDATRGLGSWSAADIVDYLKKGHNRLEGASGPMAEEIANSSSKMSDNDLNAIATFLKDQHAETSARQALPPDDEFMKAGAAIYQDRCSACHKADGTGIPYLIPDLATSSSPASRELTTLLRVLISGAQSVATKEEPTGPAMPAFGRQLTDAQIAAVATYIRNSWGHAAPAVAPADVDDARSSLGHESAD